MIRIYFHPRLNKNIYTFEHNNVPIELDNGLKYNSIYVVKIDNVSFTFYSKKGNARTKPELMIFTSTFPFEISFIIKGNAVKLTSKKIKELIEESIIIAVEAN